MEILTSTMLVAIATRIYDHFKNSKSSEERKVIFSEYLNDVYITLRDMADDARLEKDLSRHCAALEVYLTHLRGHFEDEQLLTGEESAQLVYCLMMAQQGPGEYGLPVLFPKNPASRLSAIQDIDKAAGIFKATLSLLKIKKVPKWWQFWKT